MPTRPNYIPTILIIDDEPFNLEFLEIVLKQKGYNTLTATNGRAGRDLAEEKKPDLILLDIMMPGENGFECASVLRLSPETSEIPFIFLTALDDVKNTNKGFDAGAVDFIVKPFDYKDVLHRIRTHLLIAQCDRRMFSGNNLVPVNSQYQKLENINIKAKSSTFRASTESTSAFIYEAAIISETTEGHLLLCITPKDEINKVYSIIKQLLSENTGPLYSPAITMRNIGMQLKKVTQADTIIYGIFSVLNREREILTVVNAGALPLIFFPSSNKPSILIERQSGPLGSLGRGLPPCSTYDMGTGARLFMFNRGMLTNFTTNGEAINTLRKHFELSAEGNIEKNCQDAGKLLQKTGKNLDGIIVAIEG
ncbi:response regulator [Maridesulfovibrio zosterae]|uniref:response regulator n=1 Tax=Maridesulfovibrio zosterae TaxID=82171 RepID=UPI00041D1511|nr:response regulator [Maridesulfovibrio zosterae]